MAGGSSLPGTSTRPGIGRAAQAGPRAKAVGACGRRAKGPPRSNAIFAFVRTVEAGSFSGAARQDGATPSAVSKMIEKLERHLGTTLFHRSTRALSLTTEGSAYYERVAPLLRALEDAAEIFDKDCEAKGKLRICLPMAIAPMMLDALTADFMHRNPGIAFEISVSDRRVDIACDGFDIVLRWGARRTEGAAPCYSASFPIALAAAPAYLERHGHPRSPEELSRAAHIRQLDGGHPRPVQFANGSSLSTRGVFDTDSVAAMRAGAVNGLGIVALPRLFVEADLRSGCLVEIIPPEPLAPARIEIVHGFGHVPPRRADLLVRFFEAQLARYADLS